MITNEPNFPPAQSIDDLVSALSEEESSSYSGILRSFQIPKNAFSSYSSWSDDAYTRNCIAENEKFELILLCWGAGQRTPIHYHGGEECWVRIVDGEFKETVYQENTSGKLRKIKSNLSKTNDITYMIDFMGCHRLENLSKKRSMSLHLYAKPIHNCKVFDEQAEEFIEKELVYDTVPELVLN